MSVDPSVLAALRAAVDSSPDNVELRLHLAETLLKAEQPTDALAHIAKVLSIQPDHRAALKLGAEAATLAGEDSRAAAYSRMADALGMESAKNLIGDLTPIREAASFDGDDEHTPDNSDLLERPDVKLKDVKGMSDVKERIELSFLGPMRNPELRKMYGKSLRGGLLMYGPPGCGKTFLARALAGELGARFLSVGLTDVVDMWMGNSEKNLHEIFMTARRSNPCVLFFDEIDALGRKRSLTREHAGRTIINQLLSELDGADNSNEGLYIVAATNHPWDVDAALRRPGRLDRTVLVLPPDQEARAGIIRAVFEDRPTQSIDFDWVAAKTPEFSGADLTHICDTASEFALHDSIRSGSPRPIDMNDVKRAMKQVKPSTRTWMESAKNYAIFANEGGDYDELAAYLRTRKIL